MTDDTLQEGEVRMQEIGELKDSVLGDTREIIIDALESADLSDAHKFENGGSKIEVFDGTIYFTSREQLSQEDKE